MTAHFPKPWCCKHRWTLCYLSVVSTAALVLQILQASGRL